MSRIELSVSDGKRVYIEEKEREMLLEVDSHTEIVWGWVGEWRGGSLGRRGPS